MAQKNNPKILVVNDDPASLLALISLLSQWATELAYDIVAARSGEEALREVLQHDFAVILLDVNMPGMDGFATAEAIHLRPRSASIPIIFVTAYHADEMNRLKGYQIGAADYLFTPVIPQILQAKVSVFVALARKNLELKKQADTLNERSIELLAINSRLEIEVREREKAVLQNKAKDEFLAMLGHELRNPLSAISSAASIIAFDGVKPDTASRAKVIIQRQSQHLSRIVDDLLDLSRVMSGKILLNKKPLELARLVGSCVDTLKATGRTDEYTLTVRSEGAWIDADPTRIEQIITNLLDNAIKYTPPGGAIEIDIRPEADQVLLELRDTGVGISSELMPHIFDVFVQGERSLDRSQGGLGVGLALVRQIVVLHGGSVSAYSAGAGEGSTFTLHLPRAAHEEPPLETPLAAGGPASHTVLLIEDNEDGREMMSLMLKAYGNRVLKAADGIEGLRIAAEGRPDIALVDIGLPGIDGYEVARRLRADPATRHIKLIALTGYGLQDDQRRAAEAGFDMHLVKPVNVDLLMQALGVHAPVLTRV
ncbi:MAG: response regulator [Pseudomonadota bacterium]